MPQRYTDKIVQQADRALEALGNEFAQNAAPTESDVLEIEFGALDVPYSRIPDLGAGTILTLNEPAQPTVTLRYGGRPAAEGILMIQDGMIAVKITRKFNGSD
ncbi:MAG: FliM/FliN family flagellar motor switch protein [Thermoguttaceae bacterium]|nr:FliM/FliN family flagellar motor switch protein [Thermoguttaceae bacterium]